VKRRAQLLATAMRWIALSLVPALFLALVRWAGGNAPTWGGLATHWGFVLIILALAHLVSPQSEGAPMPARPAVAIGIALSAAAMGGIYALSQATWAAWGLIGLAYALLLVLERLLASEPMLQRWAWRAFLAAIAGSLPTAVCQIESHFADEEFFVMLQVATMSVFWLLLLVASSRLSPGPPGGEGGRAWAGRRVVAILCSLLVLVGSFVTVRAYQRSFYLAAAPSYPGISEQRPMLCGEVAPSPQTYDGEEVFWRLLARVEENPQKEAPEYGMLALATGDQKWAAAFRRSLLNEATQGRFTDPAHSVKWTQHEAAFRAYYYPRVRDRFPGLFAESEVEQVQEWFAAINKRALTTEWVDLMYAVAFTKWPEGPYENQENGAGLLALLEVAGLADPELSARNEGYLARNPRGWIARFRVTDDAVFYQPEWIYNAYFQSLYSGGGLATNKRLSFEWLLAQSLPDGSPLQYNLSESTSLAGIAYVGAYWLNDPHLLWLAGRAVQGLEQAGRPMSAQPGLEEPVQLRGVSPSAGSCLIYGDSGLPNQEGPLAPDKIVFRDGWSSDSAYLLLNLRFSGWHRYKATNTITLVYQDGPLATDVVRGESAAWLPEGRSVFRDKRIPRENLNGLVVERTGMSAVLQALTGVSGKWAQDPPYYAEVVSFQTGQEKDWAHTRTTDWRGWEHNRWIYFYHEGGPIVIVDTAQGAAGSEAALVWHFVEGAAMETHRFLLRGGDEPREVALIPVEDKGQVEVTERGEEGDGGLDVVYGRPVDGELRLVTVFLQEEWVGAEVRQETGGEITISGIDREIVVALPKNDDASTGSER
jgi:hypothetical protein